MALQVHTYSEIDRAEWGRLVHASSTGTWFQTPEAYEFWASMPELFRPFVSAISCQLSEIRNQTLRGVCVGYVTVEKNPIRQFFTRRAIIIGGPALVDDCTDEEVNELMKAVRNGLQGHNEADSLRSDAIYIETRNFNDYSRWRGAFEEAGFEYKAHLNFHVDCRDAEAMWNRMSDNRRRQIRRVKDDGACEGVTEQNVMEWYAILAELYRTKVRTPLFPMSFFLEAYRQGIGHYMMVRHEGKIIGGSMIVRDEKCAYEWFECGLNTEYKDQYPSVMATYAGMQYAHENGCQRYDMMGAGVPGVPYGVRDFKAEFGGEKVEQGRFLYIANPILYALGKTGVKMMKGMRVC